MEMTDKVMVAIIRTNRQYCLEKEDYEYLRETISDWNEVTQDELEYIKIWIDSKSSYSTVYQVLELIPKPTIQSIIAEGIAIKKAEDDSRAKREAAAKQRAEKAAQRAQKKKDENEKKLFQELKQKFETPDSKS